MVRWLFKTMYGDSEFLVQEKDVTLCQHPRSDVGSCGYKVAFCSALWQGVGYPSAVYSVNSISPLRKSW